MSDLRTIVVGDVHGCLSELRELLQKCDLRLSDQLVFVGDLIDKGPQSVGTLSYVSRLQATYDVEVVLGNHEDKLLRYLRHVSDGDAAVADSMANRKPELLSYRDASVNHHRFLGSMKLWVRTRVGDNLVVHGGIPPRAELLPPQHMWRSAMRETKKIANEMLRLRCVRPDGKMVPTREEQPDDVFWAERYDGRFGTVIYGHDPSLTGQPRIFQHAIGIDLGCCYGSALGALVLHGRSMDLVTVPARRKYVQRWGANDV